MPGQPRPSGTSVPTMPTSYRQRRDWLIHLDEIDSRRIEHFDSGEVISAIADALEVDNEVSRVFDSGVRLSRSATRHAYQLWKDARRSVARLDSDDEPAAVFRALMLAGWQHFTERIAVAGLVPHRSSLSEAFEAPHLRALVPEVSRGLQR